jgi:hypothetical protein
MEFGMPRILYFFESKIIPGMWCKTSEENVKMWAEDGHKVKKVIYPDPPSRPKIILESRKPEGSL